MPAQQFVALKLWCLPVPERTLQRSKSEGSLEQQYALQEFTYPSFEMLAGIVPLCLNSTFWQRLGQKVPD